MQYASTYYYTVIIYCFFYFIITVPSIKNRISRTCGWVESNYNDKCYHRSGFGGKQDVCTCSTDYCNSAQNTYIAFATVMAASFAILIL